MGFWALFSREIVDHLKQRQLHAAVAICFTISLLTVFAHALDYSDANRERLMFIQRWPTTISEQLRRHEQIEVVNLRSISVLSVLATGQEETLPFRFASTKEGIRYGEPRLARVTGPSLTTDLAFVVTTLLSLLAMTLTFDSICGERADGTLSLLLSYPVSRSEVLAAKGAAAIVVCATCLLTSVFVAFVYVSTNPMAHVDGLRWACYVAAAIAYISFFVVAGLAISARAESRSDAALAALFVWMLTVFIIPRAITMVLSMLHPQSVAAAIQLQEEEVASRLKLDATRKRSAAFQRYSQVGSGGSVLAAQARLQREIFEIDAEYRLERARAVRSLRNVLEDREERYRARERNLMAISAPLLFNQIASELANTGALQASKFFKDTLHYDDNTGRDLAESQHFIFAGGTGSSVPAALVQKPPVGAAPFQTMWVQSSDVFREILTPFVILILTTLLGTCVAWREIMRLDVRP